VYPLSLDQPSSLLGGDRIQCAEAGVLVRQQESPVRPAIARPINLWLLAPTREASAGGVRPIFPSSPHRRAVGSDLSTTQKGLASCGHKSGATGVSRNPPGRSREREFGNCGARKDQCQSPAWSTDRSMEEQIRPSRMTSPVPRAPGRQWLLLMQAMITIKARAATHGPMIARDLARRNRPGLIDVSGPYGLPYPGAQVATDMLALFATT